MEATQRNIRIERVGAVWNKTRYYFGMSLHLILLLPAQPTLYTKQFGHEGLNLSSLFYEDHIYTWVVARAGKL
jgi:hypothetical protein